MKPDDRTNTVNPVQGASLIQVTHIYNQPPNREAIRRARKALHEAREDNAYHCAEIDRLRKERSRMFAENVEIREQANKAEGLALAVDRAITQRDEARRERDIARDARQAVEKTIREIASETRKVPLINLSDGLYRAIFAAEDLVGK